MLCAARASGRAAPSLRRAQRKARSSTVVPSLKGGPFCAPIGGPVSTPIDTLWEKRGWEARLAQTTPVEVGTLGTSRSAACFSAGQHFRPVADFPRFQKSQQGRTERFPPRLAMNAIAPTFEIPPAASMPALSGPDRPAQCRERRAPLGRGRTIPAGSAAPYETSKRGRRSIAVALAWTETLPYLRPVVGAACPWIASATFSSIPTSAEIVLNRCRQA